MYSSNPKIFEIPRMISRKPKSPFMPKIRIDPLLKERFQSIKELDYEFQRFILKEEDYSQIVQDAYASNVHWSTKIEGNPLSEDEVKRITRESFSGSGKERPIGPAQEVINHLAILIMPDTFKLPWDAEVFKRVNHGLLFNIGTEIEGGKYRTGEGTILDSDGTVAFVATPPAAIIGQTALLLDWINNYSAAYEPLVSATVMFHEFESIHPFPDGNGRTGRTLFHLYLQLNGLLNSHLCKVDQKVLSNKTAYYQLLAYTDYKENYDELIDYMSDAILSSYRDTHEELKRKDLLSSGMEEIEKRLLVMAKNLGAWFRPSDAYSWVDCRSDQTVRNYLNKLCEEKILEKKGHTNSVMFRFRNPFEGWKKTFEQLTMNLTAENPFKE
jgi:Fic family protein